MAKKKIAIVTGASRGLGLEFVKLLLKEDLDEIWMIARSEEKMKKIKEKLGKKIVVCPMDLSRWEEIKELGERLAKEKVYIMYLINNAGMAKFCSYGDLSVEEMPSYGKSEYQRRCGNGTCVSPIYGKRKSCGQYSIPGGFSAIAVPEYIQFNKSLCPQLYESFKCGIKGNGNPGYGSLSGVDEHRTD